MKRIVHIVEDLKIGGLERVVESIAYNLDRDKFKIKIICLHGRGRIFDEIKSRGLNIECVKMGGFWDLWGLLKTILIIKRYKTDIVHTHGVANTIGRTAAIAAGVKNIIAHVHTLRSFAGPKERIKELLLNKKSSCVIFCSQAAHQAYVKAYGGELSRYEILYNGIDVDLFTPKISDETEKKEYYVIGCVGSFAEHKGQEYLIKAVRAVDKDFEHPIKLVLVGKGEKLPRLRELTVKLKIDDIVFFHDVVSDVSSLIDWFDVFVMPSVFKEGLGIALLEAMAAGKPVVATNVGGIPEIIEDGVNGFLIPPRKPKAISDAVLKILKDKELARSLGRAGRKTVVARFTGKEMIARLENIYMEMR